VWGTAIFRTLGDFSEIQIVDLGQRNTYVFIWAINIGGCVEKKIWVLGTYQELGDYHEWVLVAYLERYLRVNNL